jgi:hypothetical protein
MAKIDNSLLRTILNTYRTLPLDEENNSMFIEDIFQRIDKHRIKVVGLADEDEAITDPTNPNTQIVHESYCHTFYRMLGLPVVSPNLNDFYCPGYYAPNMTDYAKVRKNINNNQGVAQLKELEQQRELISASNISKFLTKDEKSTKYKLAMLKYPRSVVKLKETTNPFEIDQQIETITNRESDFSKVQHILRPFRCNASISTTEKILVPNKNLAAPFYDSPIDPQFESYSKTYLETVCRIRFNTLASKIQTNAIKTLTEALKNIQVGGSSIYQNIIGTQTIIEVYALNILTNNFILACIEYATKIKEYKSLAAKYSSLVSESSLLANDIADLEKKKLWYQSVLTYIPNEISNVYGTGVQTNNPEDGVLSAPLLSILNAPVSQIDRLLKEKTDQKNKHMNEINKLSADMFYMTGEVYGISVLEIMALMIAFWAIPQKSLLSMLDAPAFERMYNRNGLLRNEVVIDRYASTNKAPPVAITEVLTQFDTVVYNLLSLADSIIAYSYKESET